MMSQLRYELQAEFDNRQQERAAGAVLAASAWMNAKPFVYRILTSELLPIPVRNAGWWLYWHVLLRLTFWTYYPVVNPATSRLLIILSIAAYMAWRRYR